MAKDRDSDTSAPAGQTAHGGQLKRPGLQHHVSHDSDSQVSDQASQSQAHYRPGKKHVVGGGTRHSARAPSYKGLSKAHHQAAASTKLTNPSQHNRRPASPSPERSERPQRPPMPPAAHRRTTSDVRLSRDSSITTLKKNHSQTTLKRNRSQVEVGKRNKSAANIKRSSSHKDVNKLKGPKGQVHFDLGTDGQEDEWVDASTSASPYLSRRGSVVSSGQSSTKAPASPETTPKQPAANPPPARTDDQNNTADRERLHHKEYLTSRLLQRTPSHGAAPKMSSETALVPPHANSPDSNLSRSSSIVYDTPKMGSAQDELTSRFVNGPSSAVNQDSGSFYSGSQAPSMRQSERVRRPLSMADLPREGRESAMNDEAEVDASALAPKSRTAAYRPPPAEKSRTQQKLNLQRASSSMEPSPGGGGVGAISASPLVGGGAHDNRDPRVGKLLERTGMEYLVVRRYQNPVARSIARLQHLPGAHKARQAPKQNGANGSMHSKKPSEPAADPSHRRQNPSEISVPRTRPSTSHRPASIHTNGANSSFEPDDEQRVHERLSGSSFVNDDDDQGGVATMLQNLWNLHLSAGQD